MSYHILISLKDKSDTNIKKQNDLLEFFIRENVRNMSIIDRNNFTKEYPEFSLTNGEISTERILNIFSFFNKSSLNEYYRDYVSDYNSNKLKEWFNYNDLKSDKQHDLTSFKKITSKDNYTKLGQLYFDAKFNRCPEIILNAIGQYLNYTEINIFKEISYIHKFVKYLNIEKFNELIKSECFEKSWIEKTKKWIKKNKDNKDEIIPMTYEKNSMVFTINPLTREIKTKSI